MLLFQYQNVLMNTFSPELIKEIISYFKDNYQIELTEEIAIEYLHSLAGLYESAKDLLEEYYSLLQETDQGK